MLEWFWNFFLHLSSFIHVAFTFTKPHGPWIIHVVTVWYNNGSDDGSGSSAVTNASMSEGSCILCDAATHNSV